jgi:hypothetical protein
LKQETLTWVPASSSANDFPVLAVFCGCIGWLAKEEHSIQEVSFGAHVCSAFGFAFDFSCVSSMRFGLLAC